MLCLTVLSIASFAFACETRAANINDLIITEFMADPSGADTYKEWVEIKNMSNVGISLNGFTLSDSSNHPITGNYIIPAGGVALICKTSDLSLNGGVNCQYTANLVLGNTSGTISLKESTTVINSVSYVEGEISIGKSRFLSSNSVWANELLNAYNSDGDYGTPGVSDVNIISGGEIIAEENGSLGANVLLTITNVQVSTNKTSALVSFDVNGDSGIVLNYGETINYGSTLTKDATQGNNSMTINNLTCNTIYHYKLKATAGAVIDETVDKTFSVDCSAIAINNISNIRTEARANDDYNQGWEWVFDLTVWEHNKLQVKFDKWISGINEINASSNVRFSVDNGVTWIVMNANNTYSDLVTISDNNANSDGIQTSLRIQVKVPEGAKIGAYQANYGIKSSN